MVCFEWLNKILEQKNYHRTPIDPLNAVDPFQPPVDPQGVHLEPVGNPYIV